MRKVNCFVAESTNKALDNRGSLWWHIGDGGL